jgi:integrase
MRRYGQFLNYCLRAGGFEANARAGGLVTPTRIDGYLAELSDRVCSVTVAQYIHKVCRTAELIAPCEDFLWLKEIANDLAFVATPSDKTSRVVETKLLVELGLTLVAEAEMARLHTPTKAAVLARNGVMIALLALCPVRLANFTELEIGQSFIKCESTWWMVLRKTKARRTDERPVPSYLNAAIDRYLEFYRPILMSRTPTQLEQTAVAPCDKAIVGAENRIGTHLWIGREATALSSSGVARSISNSTVTALGIDVSPHLFRAAAATTAALYASEMPHLASALLQHVDPGVTEDHYIRANSLSVVQDYARIIRNLSDIL